MLIAALRDLPVGDEWKLRVGGSGQEAEMQRMRSLAARLPIHFLGHVDSATFLADLDVLVVPSLWIEPFGRVIGEAYAAGVPVLGANVGGIAELVGRVDPEWLFEAGDVGALRAKLLRTIGGGRSALPHPVQFQSTLQDLTWSRVTERFDTLYAEALSSP
jgi:glycosyltransferase involved in cell wall biosynthesis